MREKLCFLCILYLHLFLDNWNPFSCGQEFPIDRETALNSVALAQPRNRMQMVNDGPLLGPKGLFTYSMLKSLWLACDVSFQFKLSVIMNLKPVPTSPQEVPRQLHHSVFLPFCRIPALFQVEPPRRWSTPPQGQPSWLPLLSARVCGRYGGCGLWERQTWGYRLNEI